MATFTEGSAGRAVLGTPALTFFRLFSSAWQPEVSARMRNLERRLGLQLPLRTASGSQATAEELLVARAQGRSCATPESWRRRSKRLRALERGALRIASSLTIAEHLLPAWLTALQASGTPMKVELRVETPTASLNSSLKTGRPGVRRGRCRAGRPRRAHVVARDELPRSRLVLETASPPWTR